MISNNRRQFCMILLPMLNNSDGRALERAFAKFKFTERETKRELVMRLKKVKMV